MIEGRRILFWDEAAGELQPLLDFLGVRPRGPGQPQHHVRRDVPRERREEIARILSSGDVFLGYMGRAECRICGAELGSRDLFGYGFMWPEKAEHYVLVHDVWTPDCDDLITAARRSRGTR